LFALLEDLPGVSEGMQSVARRNKLGRHGWNGGRHRNVELRKVAKRVLARWSSFLGAFLMEDAAPRADLPSAPGLSPKVLLRIARSPQSSAASVRLSRSELPLAVVIAECVARAIYQLHFSGEEPGELSSRNVLEKNFLREDG
jgi:hypothetical protein